MTLEPLLSAPLAVQLHVATVLPAAVLGAYLLARPKGTPRHRFLGRIWMVLMVLTSLSSFFIHTIRLAGPFSPIHLLSLMTLAGCVQAIRAARRGDIRAHRRAVTWMYAGGIGVAGLFTMLPGRIMHAVVFEGSSTLALAAALAFLLVLSLATMRMRPLKTGG
ncbi:DUF2306 domain-containing protein [Gellertiella hungarica]|uniref:Putative membrane protein n=1 Tax=Gellertiella hungarica TaxID=1572859 RepID=A0A7W6J286_9HYPH|nr:DUF2306 domain-containing protein [Gellertiella hungarica]MBB4063446.1 putative membrane protein [Gellertiella hungarica]